LSIINRYVIHGDIIGARAICRRVLPRTCVHHDFSWPVAAGVGNICRALILAFAIGYLPVNRNFPRSPGYSGGVPTVSYIELFFVLHDNLVHNLRRRKLFRKIERQHL